MKDSNAYFTIEAALVLPLVIGAMMMGLYLFCYQYDRCLLEQDMGSLLIFSCAQATENADSTDEIRENIELRAGELNRKKYAAWELTTLDIKLEKNHISIIGQGQLTFPVPGWNLWNNKNVWEAKVSYGSNRLSPVFYIRQYRKIHGLFQKNR